MKKAFKVCHKKMTKFLRNPGKKGKKTPKTLATAHEVTQDPNDMEKGDKVGSSIKGSKKTSVCVTPHPSLKTPPLYNIIQTTKLIHYTRH